MVFQGVEHDIFQANGHINEYNQYYISYRYTASGTLARIFGEAIKHIGDTSISNFLQTTFIETPGNTLLISEHLIGYFQRVQEGEIRHFIYFEYNGKTNKSIEEQKERCYGGFPTNLVYKNPEIELLRDKQEILKSIIII